MPSLSTFFYTTLAIVAVVALHRFLTYAEARGWIYYRRKRGSYGGLGVTSEWLNMYDPSRRHVQQAVRTQEWKRDEDDDGDGRNDDPVAAADGYDGTDAVRR